MSIEQVRTETKNSSNVTQGCLSNLTTRAVLFCSVGVLLLAFVIAGLVLYQCLGFSFLFFVIPVIIFVLALMILFIKAPFLRAPPAKISSLSLQDPILY